MSEWGISLFFSCVSCSPLTKNQPQPVQGPPPVKQSQTGWKLCPLRSFSSDSNVFPKKLRSAPLNIASVMSLWWRAPAGAHTERIHVKSNKSDVINWVVKLPGGGVRGGGCLFWWLRGSSLCAHTHSNTHSLTHSLSSAPVLRGDCRAEVDASCLAR